MPLFEFESRIEELIKKFPNSFSPDEATRAALAASFAGRDDDLEDYLDAATSVSSIGIEGNEPAHGAGPAPFDFDAQTFRSGEDFTWDGITAVTVSRAGVVYVTGNVNASAGGGICAVNFLHNGADVLGGTSGDNNGALGWRGSCAKSLVVQEGDNLELSVFQNAGFNLDISAALEVSYRSAEA